jgi:hypothetical protein
MTKKQGARLEEGLKVSLAQQRSGQIFGPFETPQEVMKFLDAANSFSFLLKEHCAKPQSWGESTIQRRSAGFLK